MKMPNTESLSFDLRRAADELLCQGAESGDGDALLAGLLMAACRVIDMLSTELRVVKASEPDLEHPGDRIMTSQPVKGSHRHKFDQRGICIAMIGDVPAPCGKVKSAGGRKPASTSSDAPPPVDPRQVAHPRIVGAHPDDHADGTMGLSGVTRR